MKRKMTDVRTKLELHPFRFKVFGFLKSPLKKRMMTDKLPSGEDEVKLLFIQPAVFVCIEMSDEFSGLEMCDVFVE